MLAKVFSGTTVGLDGVLIEVEVDVAEKGFPSLTIVGLPDKTVDEAKDRVKTAIINAGFEIPNSRITVNLAPADLPKEGSCFDLPIAVGILAASGMISTEIFNNSIFLGELSLEGKLRSVPGAISIAILAKKTGIENFFLPINNSLEVSLVNNLNIYPTFNLSDLILHFNQQKLIEPLRKTDWRNLFKEEKYEFDFSDIRGQEQAKRAMIIAAAGFHNLHLKGPPGTGKTMLSRAFPSILPVMDEEEIIEVSKIYSISGLLSDNFFVINRPFRSPHHTTSRIGLVGGGSKPAPGEVSFAHRGVLFLDEFPEFPRSVLEALRQPLEDGKVTISRATGSLTFPCRFLLLAASNPCPCGYLGHPKRSCRCMPGNILRYKKRISGPLLDRIDLHIDVPPVEEEKLISYELGVKSNEIRKKVIKARQIQKKRLNNLKIKTNGEMGSAEIKKHCLLSPKAIDLLKQAISRLSLSARSYFKTIKVAQTIADLEEKEKIEVDFVAEALQYRVKEE